MSDSGGWKKREFQMIWITTGSGPRQKQEKLELIRPSSIGQASRIVSVTPADISVLLIDLEQRRRKNKKQI